MKIIPESHVDHIQEAHKVFILEQFGDRQEGFKIESIDLPVNLPDLTMGLYGPIVGDPPVLESEVVYVERPGRIGKSRMVRRPSRSTRTMTVIYGHHGEHGCVLFTAYGGPCAPKEPTDPMLKPHEREASEEFWSKHALAMD